jgi:hypothetical protein
VAPAGVLPGASWLPWGCPRRPPLPRTCPLVRGSGQVMLPALQVPSPAPQRGAKELAIDGWHHLVYAGVTGAAYELPGHAR